jgi:hypothetical protein
MLTVMQKMRAKMGGKDDDDDDDSVCGDDDEMASLLAEVRSPRVPDVPLPRWL